jgi:hypothetical protein
MRSGIFNFGWLTGTTVRFTVVPMNGGAPGFETPRVVDIDNYVQHAVLPECDFIVALCKDGIDVLFRMFVDCCNNEIAARVAIPAELLGLPSSVVVLDDGGVSNTIYFRLTADTGATTVFAVDPSALDVKMTVPSDNLRAFATYLHYTTRRVFVAPLWRRWLAWLSGRAVDTTCELLADGDELHQLPLPEDVAQDFNDSAMFYGRICLIRKWPTEQWVLLYMYDSTPRGGATLIYDVTWSESGNRVFHLRGRAPGKVVYLEGRNFLK